MKRRRSRLQFSEASAEEKSRREDIRAQREAFYAERRGERPYQAEPYKAPAVEQPKAATVDIPEDWEDLHWKSRAALAKECWPGGQFVNGADADEAIRRYLGTSK